MRLKIFTVLICLTLAMMFAGCEQFSRIENRQDATVPLQGETAVSEQEIQALFVELISRPELVPNEIPDEIICTEYTNLGLLRIYFTGEPNAKLKLQVIKGNERIVYNLFGDGRIEDFSLQYGSGEYTVRIMQNIENDQYFAAESKTFEVSLDDETQVYLNSIQNVDWDYDKIPIQDVPYLISVSLTSEDSDLLYSCSNDLYFFMTNNIDYTRNKISDLQYNYLPDIEQTYLDRTGLCYDYASLYAAMLRSIGVPAKLVKGYASSDPNVYHAWTEIFIDGRWMILDPTLGAGAFGERNLIDAEKFADDYMKVYEY